LFRFRLAAQSDTALKELERLVDGVRNNQPKLAAEWTEMLPARRKREMRKLFGVDADRLRHEGWGALNLGFLSQAVIDRFKVKLGKALNFKYNKKLFDGVIYTRDINSLTEPNFSDLMGQILSTAPLESNPKRNGKSLKNQFFYRCNFSPEHEAFYAVVQFSEQFIFQLIVVNWKMANELDAGADLLSDPAFSAFRFPCPLRYRDGDYCPLPVAWPSST
jgi:hypothetical protein